MYKFSINEIVLATKGKLLKKNSNQEITYISF